MTNQMTLPSSNEPELLANNAFGSVDEGFVNSHNLPTISKFRLSIVRTYGVPVQAEILVSEKWSSEQGGCPYVVCQAAVGSFVAG
ncbi:MAG: hypothetical protein Q4C85_07985, partial [Actinomyces sp.]|uniref:hypothetical protein n=1 Tax=Actinomyces sp. TaxID=29317 RepID=UPI0026DB3412